jgi:hypothetical protein
MNEPRKNAITQRFLTGLRSRGAPNRGSSTASVMNTQVAEFARDSSGRVRSCSADAVRLFCAGTRRTGKTLLLAPVFYSIFVLGLKWIKWEATESR